MIDAKQVQQEAQRQLVKEQMEGATEKLKELYSKREKAQLIVRNIDREIDTYLSEIGEAVIYQAAGVKPGNK